MTFNLIHKKKSIHHQVLSIKWTNNNWEFFWSIEWIDPPCTIQQLIHILEFSSNFFKFSLMCSHFIHLIIRVPSIMDDCYWMIIDIECIGYDLFTNIYLKSYFIHSCCEEKIWQLYFCLPFFMYSLFPILISKGTIHYWAILSKILLFLGIDNANMTKHMLCLYYPIFPYLK